MTYQEDISRRAKEVRARLWNTPPRPVAVEMPVEPAKTAPARPTGPRDVPPTIQEVILFASAYFGIDPADLTGIRKTWPLVRQRQIAVYISWSVTKKGFPLVAQAFGRRDHTTALHSRDVIKTALDAGDLHVGTAVKGIMTSLRLPFEWNHPLVDEINLKGPIQAPRSNWWTPEQTAALLQHYDKKGGRAKVMEVTGRSHKGVQNKSAELGLRLKRDAAPFWTPREDDLLRKFYRAKRLWAFRVSIETGRTMNAAHHRARLLGLNKKDDPS